MSAIDPYKDITAWIPHRPPIVLLDEIIAVETNWTQTAFRICEDSLFVANGVFSEMGLLENIAQTSFIFLKKMFADQQDSLWGAEVESLGYISNITELSVYRLPAVGSRIYTRTENELVFTSDFLKICNISGTVSVQDEVLMTANMKMVLQTKTL